MAGHTIRAAEDADARAILDYLVELTMEPELPLLLSRELVLGFTVESELEMLGRYHARSEGVSRIELEVVSDNARAIHLYQRMGFTAEGLRRRAFIKDGVQIDSQGATGCPFDLDR